MHTTQTAFRVLAFASDDAAQSGNAIVQSAIASGAIVPAADDSGPSLAEHAAKLSAERAAAEATRTAQAKLAAQAAKLAERRAANIAAGKPANAPTAQPKLSTGKPSAKPTSKAAKQAASKPSAAKPAKPTSAEREAAQRASADNRALAKAVAAGAVAVFYSGASKPFKPASDTFAPINRTNAKPGPTGLGTQRQAALLLALVTYGANNIKRNGTFVRGGFRVPARLVNPKAPADATILAQPESGCLGNCLGLTVAYVSGPTSGAAQRDAVYRIDYKQAGKLIQATFGDKQAEAFAKLAAALAA